MTEDKKPRDITSAQATGLNASSATAIPNARDEDTRPGDASRPDSPEHDKFRRGRAAVELLETIRFVHPERLADLADFTSSALPADIPRSLGRFQVLRELGQGGHGVVLLAHDPQLNRRVALKVPRPETLMTADLRRRFLREAEAAAALNHPNIVPIYEKGTIGPLCYVASGYCSGPSLATWLAGQTQPVPLRQAAQIVRALADAVQHAHSRGVLHRDLKPANVLLAEPTDAQGYANPPTTAAPEVAEATDPAADGLADSFPTPYIIDFGLARVEGTSGHTASSAIIGTPAYMAPEQAAGRNQEVTAAADIYGLGTILYQLLTRQLPFQGHSDLETLQAVQFAEPTAPRRIRGEIPRDLEAICLRCLEKSPSHRYASAASLYADLGRFLAGAPVEARSIGRVERLRRWARRNPALAAVSAVAGVLFFVGAASVTWQWWRAERSLAELREQQDRATRYLHSAQEAVDELLTDLAAELGDLPQTEMIRGRLLRRAAVINQRFLNDETLDPAAAGLVSIQAWYRAANIARQLGDLDGMQAALERMIALCGAQPASGRDPDILAKQISAQAMLSSAAVARNDWTESQRHLQDGLELLDRSREQPTAYRNLLRAELLRNLGMDAERQGQLDEANVHYGRAMELVTQTPTLYDDDSQLTLIRVKAHNSFAIHCKQLGKFPEASQHFQATQELLATLRKRAPDSAELQAMMAQNQYNLANLDLAAQRHGPARARYLNAKNDFKQLAARFPGIVKYRDLWCYSLQGAALASPEPEQFKNRVLMLKKAAFLREEIARDYPDLVDNAVQLAKAYRNLGRDYFGARQYTEARHCLRRAVECGPGANASAAVQGYDRENDTAACSLLGRLEMKCQNWGQAVVWFGQAISLRDAGGSRFQDTDDYVRDQAAYGKALVRADRRDEGIRHLRALPASTPDRPTRDLIVARALLDVAELVADATAERVADKSLARELRTDAIARLHSAWQHGDDHVQDFALSPEAEVLGAIPQFQELLAEMRSSSTRPNP